MPMLSDFFKETLEPIIGGWIVDGIMENLAAMFASVQGQTVEIQSALTQSAADFDGGTLWHTAITVAGDVMTPIAALILAGVMGVELIGWAQQRNRLQDAADVSWMLFEFLVKLCIGVVLFFNADKITNGIFQLGAFIVAQVSGGGGGSSFGSAADLAAMRSNLESGRNIGYLMATLVMALLGRAVIWAISILVEVIVIGRVFKICLYASMGAVPYATLMQSKISDIGVNYIKNLFALAFQGFFMFVIVVMYQALTRNVAVSSEPNEAIFTLLKYSIVFVMALFNSSALAKSIFNAH